MSEAIYVPPPPAVEEVYNPAPGDVVNVITTRQGTVDVVKGNRVVVKLGGDEKTIVNASDLKLVSKAIGQHS